MYGTNMIKYKYDPLAVIEAKFAMAQEKGDGDGSDPIFDEGSKNPTKVNTDIGTQNVEVPTQPSPGVGTQEPAIEWSSQEENIELKNDGKEIFSGKTAGKH
jgi:hypothetical protein